MLYARRGSVPPGEAAGVPTDKAILKQQMDTGQAGPARTRGWTKMVAQRQEGGKEAGI